MLKVGLKIGGYKNRREKKYRLIDWLAVFLSCRYLLPCWYAR
jgi:hypothetical protein